MYFKIAPLIVLLFVSCKERKASFDFDSSIPFAVYRSQLEDIENNLDKYADLTEQGKFYFKESLVLDTIFDILRNKIEFGGVVSEHESQALFKHFEETISGRKLVNLEIMNELKNLPVQSVTDLDYLLYFFKRGYVDILLENKLLPFNNWSTMASAERWEIRDGEPFELSLANTAFNTEQPHEWYLVKDLNENLNTGNIIDTLYMDGIGIVKFSTKNYKKGENRLFFISRLSTSANDRMLSKEVKFIVR
jgi:hypothetical protein